MHPVSSDFSGDAGRIPISKRSDDPVAYHTAAQTDNRKVVISACIEPMEAGRTVYFEVLDPDDPVDDGNEAYKERKNKTSDVKDSGDLMDEVDSDPNDNRDPVRTMAGGTLAKYNDLQTNGLSSRSAQTVIKEIHGEQCAVAEVTLTITDRYAGDRYRVRATCVDPEGKPFNQNSNVTEQGAQHAGISESAIESTVHLVAWKRVYIHKLKMFRAGSDLAKDVVAPTNIVVVDDASVFSENDSVQVFDPEDKEGEIREVQSIDHNQNKITLTEALTTNFSAPVEKGMGGHVGRLTGSNDFYQADTADIQWIWNQAFVEVIFLGEDICPFYPEIPADEQDDFAFDTWGRLDSITENDNYFHIIGAHSEEGRPDLWGTRWPILDLMWVFVQIIEDDNPTNSIDPNKLTTVHEMTHGFQGDPRPGQVDSMGHHQIAQNGVVPVANSYCVMNADPAVFEPRRWCIFHVYAVRDQEDDIVS